MKHAWLAGALVACGPAQHAPLPAPPPPPPPPPADAAAASPEARPQDDISWSLDLESRVRGGYSPTAAERARYQAVADKLSTKRELETQTAQLTAYKEQNGSHVLLAGSYEVSASAPLSVNGVTIPGGEEPEIDAITDDGTTDFAVSAVVVGSSASHSVHFTANEVSNSDGKKVLVVAQSLEARPNPYTLDFTITSTATDPHFVRFIAYGRTPKP